MALHWTDEEDNLHNTARCCKKSKQMWHAGRSIIWTLSSHRLEVSYSRPPDTTGNDPDSIFPIHQLNFETYTNLEEPLWWGQIQSTFQDKWGCWTSQTFQGRESVIVTIISAHQLVTDSPGKGLTTAASQQFSLLLQEQDPITAPRVAFRRDLRKYTHRYQGERH